MWIWIWQVMSDVRNHFDLGSSNFGASFSWDLLTTHSQMTRPSSGVWNSGGRFINWKVAILPIACDQTRERMEPASVPGNGLPRAPWKAWLQRTPCLHKNCTMWNLVSRNIILWKHQFVGVSCEFFIAMVDCKGVEVGNPPAECIPKPYKLRELEQVLQTDRNVILCRCQICFWAVQNHFSPKSSSCWCNMFERHKNNEK